MHETPTSANRVTVQQLRPFIYRTTFVDTMFDSFARNAEYGDLPMSVYTAAYGIQWARQTGRLPGAVEVTIRAMTPAQVCKLVADTANSCPTIGDVPRYLIRRFVPASD